MPRMVVVSAVRSSLVRSLKSRCLVYADLTYTCSHDEGSQGRQYLPQFLRAHLFTYTDLPSYSSTASNNPIYMSQTHLYHIALCTENKANNCTNSLWKWNPQSSPSRVHLSVACSFLHFSISSSLFLSLPFALIFCLLSLPALVFPRFR